MSKPTVISVFGTRPEAIKMAPVVRLLDADGDIAHHVVVTAQHRELLDDVLGLFGITPTHDLGLMVEQQSLEHISATALTGLGGVFDELQPDYVLVHGDTTTTAMAALAAFYRRIPVGHVEAGLRTSTVAAPFPEELNRRIADQIAAYYFCPTAAAAANLSRCGEYGGEALITGNTALDAVRLTRNDNYVFSDPVLADFAGHDGAKLLVTAHRRENWGAPLAEICHGILLALTDNPQARACFCWHPNPVVREVIAPILADQPRVLLIDPPRYDVFINLLAACDLTLTDSGGIQEEVSYLQRYALVLRNETERPEAVTAGFAELVSPERNAIRSAVAGTLLKCVSDELPGSDSSPFGDGHAAERIHTAVRLALGIADILPENWHPAG